MRCLTILIAFALVFAAPVLLAQEPEPVEAKGLKSTDDTKELTAKFLRSLSAGTTFEAFALMKDSAAAESAPDIDEARDTMVAMLETLRPTYGKPVGFDMLAERTLGGSLIRYESILKLEHNAVRCTVTYYKATNTWAPLRVWFDQDVDSLYAELGR